MSKYTVLQMVQQILSSMDSDQVNSINDTPEALQVANCLLQSYNNMLGRYDLPEHNQLLQLTATSASTPTLMLKPETGVQRVEWVKYYNSNPAEGSGAQFNTQFGAYSHGLNTNIVNNQWFTTSTTSVTMPTVSALPTTVTFTVPSGLTAITTGSGMQAFSGANFMIGSVLSYSGTTLIMTVTTVIGAGTYAQWNLTSDVGAQAPPGYQDITLLIPEDFFAMTDSFNPTESTVGSYVFSVNDNYTGAPYSFTVYYKNDKQPRYCTIIGNAYFFFDSYDSTQEQFLTAGKSKVYGWVIPQFTVADNFTPVLDDQQFPMLINEAKSLAFLELKQTQHPKAEQEVTKQLFSLQKFKHVGNKPSQFSLLPSFGRRGMGYGGFSSFTTTKSN